MDDQIDTDSVGVPDITEDHFFEEFGGISQIQTKKRVHIGKEVHNRKRGLSLPSAKLLGIDGPRFLESLDPEEQRDQLFKRLVKLAIHRASKYGGFENEELYSKKLFKKSDADFNWFAEQVKSENKIRHVLDVGIIEAKELAGKDIEGTSDPYATIHIVQTKDKNKDSDTSNFRVTKVENANLNPKWDEHFTVRLSEGKDEEIIVMLWDHDEEQSAKAAVKELSKIKSVGGLGRYITQLAQTAAKNNTHDFLGMVTVPIKEISLNGIDEWYTLQQRTSKSNVSGQLHLKLMVNSVDAAYNEEQSKLFQLHKQLYSYLVLHEGKKQCQDSISLWGFRIPTESECILDMHLNFSGLTEEHGTIARWQAQLAFYMEVGGSEEVLVETLAEVLESSDTSLTTEEADELSLTLCSFGHYVRAILSDITSYCSPHKKTELKTVSDLVRGYLMLFKIDLWNPRHEEDDIKKLSENAAKLLYDKVVAADKTTQQDMKSQLESLNRTTIRLNSELESFSSDYKPIFKSCKFDVKVVVYETVITLLLKDVHKVMGGVNKAWSKVLPDATPVLAATFVLYNSINQLVQANDETNDKAARLQKLFSDNFGDLVKKWSSVTHTKLSSHSEKLIIMEKIQSDPSIEESSTSTREVVRSVNNICKCWQDLNIPICEQNSSLFFGLVVTLTSHLLHFATQLKQLVEEMRYFATYDPQFDIQDEMIIAFNNIALLRAVNNNLENDLKIQLWRDDTVKLMEIVQVNGLAIEHEMITLSNGLVDKMEPSLEKFVLELRKANPDVSAQQVLGILLDYLDNNISLVGRMQDKGTFTSILVNIWGKICSKLKDVVETKPELQEEHYTRVGDSLKFLKHHFQHQGGTMMEENMTAHPQYIEVNDVMELQKTKTEELIIRHYKEQSSDRGERSTGAGVIDLKLSLKERRDGKAILFVKLLGARELIALDSNGKSDPFIVLQVVPSHLYPDCEQKQSTVKKGTLEPIYNEMFEFIIPQGNIPHGVLVISVFDYDFISANDFEGEAMVRLTDLPRNSEQHVKWTMALHRPKKDSIYKILEGRSNDKMAMKFVDIRRKAVEAELLEDDKQEG